MTAKDVLAPDSGSDTMVESLERLCALHPELHPQMESYVRMRLAALRRVNQALEADLARCRASEGGLRRSENELLLLWRESIVTHEHEREKAANQLRDNVSQTLYAVKYSLERIDELTWRASSGDAQAVLRDAIANLRDALEDIRNIATSLRPVVPG